LGQPAKSTAFRLVTTACYHAATILLPSATCAAKKNPRSRLTADKSWLRGRQKGSSAVNRSTVYISVRCMSRPQAGENRPARKEKPLQLLPAATGARRMPREPRPGFTGTNIRFRQACQARFAAAGDAPKRSPRDGRHHHGGELAPENSGPTSLRGNQYWFPRRVSRPQAQQHVPDQART
jgi:hypothetical protein